MRGHANRTSVPAGRFPEGSAGAAPQRGRHRPLQQVSAAPAVCPRGVRRLAVLPVVSAAGSPPRRRSPSSASVVGGRVEGRGPGSRSHEDVLTSDTNGELRGPPIPPQLRGLAAGRELGMSTVFISSLSHAAHVADLESPAPPVVALIPLVSTSSRGWTTPRSRSPIANRRQSHAGGLRAKARPRLASPHYSL